MAKCLKDTAESAKSPILLILSAPSASSNATLCLRERLSSFISESRSLDTNLSNSSASSTSDIPASNVIAFFGLVEAIRYLSISGGTNSNASKGPIVLPVEEDIAP